MKRSWITPACALLLAATTSYAASPDPMLRIRAQAKELVKSQPPALWSVPTDARSADIIQFFGEDRVLVGEVVGGSLYKQPYYGPLKLLDAGNGRILWKARRERSMSMNHVLLALSPGLLFAMRPEP